MKDALDTGALILAFQEVSLSDLPADRARHECQRGRLLPFLDRHPGPLIIPAVVFAEFLYGLPPDLARYATGEFPKKFRIAPMTARTAMIASEIRTCLVIGGNEAQALIDYGTTKNAFRADLWVMASCRAEGCRRVITRDGRMRSAAARAGIPLLHVDDLPLPDPWGSLFESSPSAE